MVVSNKSALGIIFPNSFDALVAQMVDLRLMASLPFASRYRLVDFVLSSMSNSGIDNVTILPQRNYHSLMDHLGSGREWDLVRKNGGLNIFPPYAESQSVAVAGRVGALVNVLRFLKSQKEEYVVMADSNIAINIDFKAMIEAHIATGADVTMAYYQDTMPESFVNSDDVNKDFCYSLDVEDGRVKDIKVNYVVDEVQNLSLNVFVVKRDLLVKLIEDANVKGYQRFTRDVLLRQIDTLNVQGYKFDGYVARICSINSYFEENMRLLEDANVDALFGAAPIYTKVRDDNPTRYITGAKVVNTMAADGCVIEGEVENSILFRGVKVAKGAKVKNCILMQDTVIEAGANVEYLITDKNVTISADKEMNGTRSYPVYVVKGYTV